MLERDNTLKVWHDMDAGQIKYSFAGECTESKTRQGARYHGSEQSLCDTAVSMVDCMILNKTAMIRMSLVNNTIKVAHSLTTHQD